jgi:hypothetical protein
MLSDRSSSQSHHHAPRWLVPVLGSMLMWSILPGAANYLPNLPTQQFQLSPSVKEPTSTPDRTAVAWAIAGLGVGILGLAWKSTQQSSVAGKTRSDRTAAGANRALQRQLLSLLHNDSQAGERLIRQTQANHPGRSIDWCAEKVIYDLQRDRH